VIRWCLGVAEIHEAAAGRGLPVQTGQMEMVDGPPRVFRTAGMPSYPLPFFISFDMDDEERMRLRERRFREAEHDCAPGGYAFVEVGDTPELLTAWIGEHDLPVRHLPDTPTGIHAARIETDRGEVALREVRPRL
jgi:hypothetical protein